MTFTSRVVAIAAIATALAPGVARADDAAQAKVLYDEGKNLFAENHFTEACTKLEASFKLNQLSGTRGLLAACYEKLNRLASAWNAYVDSAAIADRSGNPQRADIARAKAAELEPRLARVTIDDAAVHGVTGAVIVVDGVVQPAAALGHKFPIDSGQHQIEARATDYRPWTTTVDIENGEEQTVVVEALVPDPTQRLAAEARQRAHHRTVRRRKLLALGLAGGGGIAVGVAAVFAMSARSQWSDAKDAGCTGDGLCPDETSAGTARSARDKANIATVVGGIGLAAIAAGVIVYVTRPSDRIAGAT